MIAMTSVSFRSRPRKIQVPSVLQVKYNNFIAYLQKPEKELWDKEGHCPECFVLNKDKSIKGLFWGSKGIDWQGFVPVDRVQSTGKKEKNSKWKHWQERQGIETGDQGYRGFIKQHCCISKSILRTIGSCGQCKTTTNTTLHAWAEPISQ